MRKNALDFVDRNAGHRDQVMPDAHQRLLDHLDVVLQQQVKMFQDRSGEAILNGNHGRIDRPRIQRRKHFRRERAWHNLRVGHELQRRLVTERARLSLNSDLHAVVFCSWPRATDRCPQTRFPFAPYHTRSIRGRAGYCASVAHAARRPCAARGGF